MKRLLRSFYSLFPCSYCQRLSVIGVIDRINHVMVFQSCHWQEQLHRSVLLILSTFKVYTIFNKFSTINNFRSEQHSTTFEEKEKQKQQKCVPKSFLCPADDRVTRCGPASSAQNERWPL